MDGGGCCIMSKTYEELIGVLLSDLLLEKAKNFALIELLIEKEVVTPTEIEEKIEKYFKNDNFREEIAESLNNANTDLFS